MVNDRRAARTAPRRSCGDGFDDTFAAPSPSRQRSEPPPGPAVAGDAYALRVGEIRGFCRGPQGRAPPELALRAFSAWPASAGSWSPSSVCRAPRIRRRRGAAAWFVALRRRPTDGAGVRALRRLPRIAARPTFARPARARARTFAEVLAPAAFSMGSSPSRQLSKRSRGSGAGPDRR